MKYISRLAFSVLAAAVLILPAQAQTYSTVKSGTSGNFVHRAADMTSGSTVAWDNVPSTSANHSVVLQSTSTSIPVVVTFALNDGTVVTSRTDTIATGPTVISFTAPLNYQKFKVSPTAIGTHTLSIDSVSTK